MKMNKTQTITVCSIMVAITFIFAFVPIKTAGLEITLAMIPVTVGAICFGEYVGLLLGGVFGLASFLQCLGFLVPSAFGAAMLEINPLFTFIVCIPTRMLAGYLAGLIFKLFRAKFNHVSYIIASLLCPLLNTTFFMSAIVLLFYNTEYIQKIVSGLGAANPFVFILLFVGINGLVELIANFLIALPCAKAVSKYLKK